jgi:hypothetical protein
MKKFLVLYQSSAAAKEQMAKATPDQAKAGMEMWMQWAQKAGTAIVDLGMPLGNAQAITQKGTSASNSNVAGFTIVQAEDAAAVAKIFDGHPHFMAPDAGIEIHEFLPLPGM